jgi:exonuclease SbcC
MRLQALTIRNFRVLKEAQLSFSDQVIGIIGPNGAGKSSIVEAIAWALYGNRVARSGKDEIRSIYAGGDECRVDLQFELNREHYSLTRRLIGRQDRMEVTLSCNGRPESAGTVETERYIAGLLGLDWRGFLTSFLARQQELNALADLAPSLRRQHLAGMLGIDRLDLALRRVKDERRVLQQSVQSYEQQQQHQNIVQQKLVELREHERHVERQQDSLAGAQASSAVEFEKTTIRHREHEALKVTCSQLTARLDSVASTLEPVAEQLDDLCSQEQRLSDAAAELGKLNDQTSGLVGLKTELAEVEKAAAVQIQVSEFKTQIADLDRQSNELNQTLTERQSEAESVQSQLSEIPKDAIDQLTRTRTELERARADWSETRADQKTNQVAETTLQKQLASIEQVGPDAICERCLRPFGKDLDGIRKHLAGESETLARRSTKLNRLLEDRRAEGDRLKNEVSRLEGLVATGREATVRSQTLQREVETARLGHRRLIDQRAGLVERLAGLGSVPFDPKRLKFLQDETGRLEQIAVRASELKGESARLPVVKASLAKTRDQAERLKIDATDLERQLKELGYDATAAAAGAEEFERQQKLFDDARRAALEGAKELEIARRDVTAREEELARLTEAGLRLEECRTNQFYTEKLVSLFGDFRKYTISRIRPRLAELSSQLIAEMSDGRYSLVELDEDYNLQIMDSGRYFGVDRFSGGEKDLASLCLRLAISLALTESAGIERSFVILDEVFGSQDTSRRELIFQSLANLKERFPQILLVTHLEELKNRVESLIELVPQPGGWSEVRVNGETT